MTAPIILASASETRARLLRDAGVTFSQIIPGVDEAAIKASMLAEKASAKDIADRIASLKAERASSAHSNTTVIGADQILVQSDHLYSKPKTLDEARFQLSELRGKTHHLLSAVVLAENGHVFWRHIGQTMLNMRKFSDDFLDHYINLEKESILDTPGCYKLEGLGAQLFHSVRGDFFSVLGLPLLELLAALRLRGLMPE